jgi:hypothetical protein
MTDVENIIAKMKGILLNSVETFQQSKDDDQKTILTYFAVLLLINSFFYAIVTYTKTGSYMASMVPGSGGIFLIFAFTVISTIILSVLFVVWLHLWVYILGGRRGLIQTAKAFVYGGTPWFLLGWIPYIGVIFLIWSFILGILGIRELHEVSTARAAIALVIAIAIPFMILLFISLYLISHLNIIPAGVYTP